MTNDNGQPCACARCGRTDDTSFEVGHRKYCVNCYMDEYGAEEE